MMNLLQVQDDLKNFSQDQLVKEMQQPSGTTPQFLVLSELNRRKRVKGDLEARQAQNQPTVAEEAVASAGVPQSGMMGMPEAMAPASADSEGIGSMMPKSMRSGGEVERYAEGGLLEGIAESVSRNQQMLDTVSQNIGKMNSNMPIQQPLAMPEPAVPSNPIMTDMRHRRPLNGFGGSPFNTGQNRIGQPLGFGGKGPQRPGRKTYGRPDSTIAGLGAFADIFNKKSPAEEPQAMAEGGVIRAQDGLPKEDSKFGDGLVDYIGGSFPAALDNLDTLGGYLNPFNYFGSDDVEEGTIIEKDTTGIDQAINDAPANIPEKKPEQKLNLTSEKPETLSIEQELLKRQAGLDKDRNFDKYMALAQAGLGILASDKPTLAGAIGEGGMKGLDAFNEANKRYEEGLNDILNARSKLQQAKIKASGKGTLDRKGALAAISSYNNDITAVRKAIQDVNNSATDPREQAVRKAALEQELNRLRYEQSQLYDSAGIRQRPTVDVAKLK
jgi:hypothetical protein